MSATQRVHHLKLKVDSDTKDLQLVKQELNKISTVTLDVKSKIRDLQNIKASAKKGLFDDDIKLSKELHSQLKQLTADYRTIEAERISSKGVEKQKKTNELMRKRLAIEKLINKEITESRNKLDLLAHSQQQAVNNERDLNRAVRDTTKSISSTISKEKQLGHQIKANTVAQRMLQSIRNDTTSMRNLVYHIRQLESVAVAVYGIKTAWDKTLGAGLQYSIEMEQIDIKLKGIIGSSATMETSTGRTLANVGEKWKLAGDMAKQLKQQMKDVAKETGSSLRDTGRILTAIMPQALQAGASVNDLGELTKGMMIAVQAGALTIKEAVNSLDNVVSGDAKASELVNYLKTIGIDMKHIKDLKGYEAIEELKEKLKELHPIAEDFVKSWKGVKQALDAEYLSTMALGVEAYKVELIDSMRSLTDWIADNQIKIVAGTTLALRKGHDLINWIAKTVTPAMDFLSVAGKSMIQTIDQTATVIGILVGYISTAVGAVAGFTKEMVYSATGIDLTSKHLAVLVGGLMGLKVLGWATSLVLRFTRTVLRMTGLTGVVEVLVGAFNWLNKSMQVSMVGGSAKAGAGMAENLGKSEKGINRLIRKFKELAKVAGLASSAGILGTAVVGAGAWKVNQNMDEASVYGGHTADVTTLDQTDRALKMLDAREAELKAGTWLDTDANDLVNLKKIHIAQQKFKKHRKEIETHEKAFKKMTDNIISYKEDEKTTWNTLKDFATPDIADLKDPSKAGGASMFSSIADDYKAEIDKLKKLSADTEDLKLNEILTFKPAKDDNSDAKKALAKLEKERLATQAKLISDQESFNEEFTRVTKGGLEADILKLNKHREELLTQGMDASKVKQWYDQSLSDVKDKWAEKEIKAQKSTKSNLAKVSAEKIKMTQEFADAYARASLTPYKNDIYQLDQQKSKFIKNKVSMLEINKWYNIEKSKIDDKYAKIELDKEEAKAKRLAGAMNIYYEASGDSMAKFQADTQQKLLELMKDGLNPEQLSVIYDFEFKKFIEGAGKAFATLEDGWHKLARTLSETFEQSLSNISTQFSKGGMGVKDIAKSLGSDLYHAGVETLKAQNDPTSKAIGYTLDILTGMLSSEEKDPINAFTGTSTSVKDSLSMLSKYSQPQFEASNKMSGYLKSIDENTLQLARVSGVKDSDLSGGGFVGSSSNSFTEGGSAIATGFATMGMSYLWGSLGFGDTTQSLEHSGMTIQDQSLRDLADSQRALVEEFQIVKSTTDYWIAKDVDYDRDSKYSQTLSEGMARAVSPMLSSIEEAMGVLYGDSGSAKASSTFDRTVINIKDLDFMDKNETERNEILQKYLSTLGDDLVDSLNSGINKYAKNGEGTYATLMRSLTEYAEASKALASTKATVNVEPLSLSDIKGTVLTASEITKQTLVSRESKVDMVAVRKAMESYQSNNKGTSYDLGGGMIATVGAGHGKIDTSTVEGQTKFLELKAFYTSWATSFTEIGEYVNGMSGSAFDIATAYNQLKDFDKQLELTGMGNFTKELIGVGDTVESITGKFQSFINQYYTEDEKRDIGITLANQQLGEIGLTLPKTVTAYKELVKSVSGGADPEKWRYLINNADYYYQFLENDLEKTTEIAKVKEGINNDDKKYLEWRRDNLKSEYDLARNVQKALLNANTLTGEWKQSFAEAIMSADGQYGTKEQQLKSMEQSMSINNKYGSGFEDWSQQEYIAKSMAYLGNVNADKTTEVTDVKQTEATMKLVDEVAIMGAKIEALNNEINRGKDAFGTTPVTIVADNTK